MIEHYYYYSRRPAGVHAGVVHFVYLFFISGLSRGAQLKGSVAARPDHLPELLARDGRDTKDRRWVARNIAPYLFRSFEGIYSAQNREVQCDKLSSCSYCEMHMVGGKVCYERVGPVAITALYVQLMFNLGQSASVPSWKVCQKCVYTAYMCT